MKIHPAKPSLSAILWTPDTYQTIRRTVAALRKQTFRDQIEVILAGPSASALDGAELDLEGFAAHQLIIADSFTKSAQVRAQCVRIARAPVVAFLQDHCFPLPEWAEALIKRYEEPWSGVGCVFLNANPDNATSWCNFLAAYGEGADPPPAGPPRLVGGHNATYRRDALMSYGDTLAEMLESSTALQWHLMKQGHRFTVESGAKMRHENFSRLVPSMRLHFHLGRVFASKRTAKWAAPIRMIYAASWPFIPPRRLARMVNASLRINHREMIPRILPVGVVLFACNAFGEAVGALSGPGRSVEWITSIEHHRQRFMIGNDR
jgi:hypothetical protein